MSPLPDDPSDPAHVVDIRTGRDRVSSIGTVGLRSSSLTSFMNGDQTTYRR
jgi:hypothetical protein